MTKQANEGAHFHTLSLNVISATGHKVIRRNRGSELRVCTAVTAIDGTSLTSVRLAVTI